MKKHLIANGLIALSLVFMPVAAQAHSASVGAKVEVKHEDNQDRGGFLTRFNKLFQKPTVDNSCNAMEGRIDKVIQNFDNNTDKKVGAYLSLKTRVAHFQAAAAAAGYDTVALQGHMTVLNGKVDKFAADYQAYINSLKTLRTLACGGSDGQFAAQLIVAKNLLTTARASGLDAQTYYKGAIKADIMAIWTQVKADYGMSFSL